MAASMITAAVGDMVMVMGIRIAVPAAGPTPGSTPTSMPRMQPATANIRVAGSRTAAKPCMRRCQVSISKTEGAGRQLHVQTVDEQVIDTEAAGRGNRRRDQEVALAEHPKKELHHREHGQ